MPSSSSSWSGLCRRTTPPTLVEGLRLLYADEHDAAGEALGRVYAAAVARGDEPAQDNALLFLTELACRAGDWERADELAEAMLQSGEGWGLEFQGGSFLWIRGLVDAYLGRLDEARARATAGCRRSAARKTSKRSSSGTLPCSA